MSKYLDSLFEAIKHGDADHQDWQEAIYAHWEDDPVPPPRGRNSPNLEAMGKEIHEFAVAKGWWNQPLEKRIPRLIEWLREEVDEVEEAYAKWGLWNTYSIDAEGEMKPEGVPSELADLYLIITDIAAVVEEVAGIPFPLAVREKLDYDKIRVFKRDAEGVRIS